MKMQENYCNSQQAGFSSFALRIFWTKIKISRKIIDFIWRHERIGVKLNHKLKYATAWRYKSVWEDVTLE